MKYLSIAIPCYNSQDYMDKAIESCLILKDDVEIIIVDDGSKDRTGQIGDDYASLYPDTIKCIHQENGGHGQAVNTGLKMQQDFILKFWIVMIGLTSLHLLK